jgi:hypothetical protein
MARGVSRSKHAIVRCASPTQCFTERVSKGDTQPWRLCRISTPSATLKRVHPPSRRCTGTIGPSRVPALRASPSVPEAPPTPSRACNAPSVKGRAARVPSMTALARAWRAASASVMHGMLAPFLVCLSCAAWRMPQRWGSMSARVTAGAGGCAMRPCPPRWSGNGRAPSKPMTSSTPRATRDRQRRAGRNREAARHGGVASSASPAGAMAFPQVWLICRSMYVLLLPACVLTTACRELRTERDIPCQHAL